MSLAQKIRALRTQADMSLDDLATKAGLSKTYLWELEKDEAGAKRPSADVLLRIAKALSTTIAELLSLPTVQIKDSPVEIPPSLREFQERMATLGNALTEPDLQDLATMRFRGGQPQTVDEWNQLYLTLVNTTRRKKR
jgi:transcriptional regulator with XRE-family HTH domain